MGNPEDNTGLERRVKEIGEYVVRSLLSTAIAQCYCFMKKHGIVGKQSFTDEKFIEVFSTVAIGEVVFHIYDNETEGVYSMAVDGKWVKNFRIREIDRDPNVDDLIWFPQFDVELQCGIRADYVGTAEGFYQYIGRDCLEIFQDGWEEYRRADVGVRPVGKLTPHDLCAYVNLIQTMSIFQRWIMYIVTTANLNSNRELLMKDDGIDCGQLFMSIYDIYGIELFISLSLQLLTHYLRLPNDVYAKKEYVARGMLDFHEKRFEGRNSEYLKAYLQGAGMDIRSVRTVDFTNPPTLELCTFTSVIAPMF